MIKLDNPAEEREKAMGNANRVLEKIRDIVAPKTEHPHDAVSLLDQVRRAVYEDLNQIPHEMLILDAIEWLLAQQKCPPDTQWSWNPRQTGGANEPDIVGRHSDSVVVSCEVTASFSPKGAIKTRMHKTLNKLAEMEGDLYYFVRTETMANCAYKQLGSDNPNHVTVVPLPLLPIAESQ